MLVLDLIHRHFNDLDTKYRDQSWKLIHKTLNRLLEDLEIFFNNFDSEQRNNYCNLLKMIVYVFCTLSELFEEKDIKQTSSVDYDNIGKKGVKKKQTNG